jgi:hypothetical protein
MQMLEGEMLLVKMNIAAAAAGALAEAADTSFSDPFP